MAIRRLPLDSLGPAAKLQRARDHLNELRSLIEDFKRRKPYSVLLDQGSQAEEIIVKLSITEYPPLVDWALIIGDIVHNLRAALDHIAFSLVILENPSADPYKIGFPIYKDFNEFSVKGKKKLRGAHADAIALVDDLKPYGGGNDLFYTLSTLDNFDKHRLLTITYAIPETIPFQIKIEQAFPGEENSLRLYYNKQFIIEAGAILGRIVCARPIKPVVKEDRSISLKMVFAEPQIVARQEVLMVLDDAVGLVQNVIQLADRLVVRLYPHLAIPNPNPSTTKG